MTKIKAIIQSTTNIVVEYETDGDINRSELYDRLHENAGLFIEEHKNNSTSEHTIYSILEMHVISD